MHMTNKEKRLLTIIKSQTDFWNKDNISRTKAYENFFIIYPEIRWSYLAGMVSRNAGWNMCDLEGVWYTKLLSQTYRRQLFLTYEEANWRIFLDAYPQLLLYHYSKVQRRPLFHLSSHFFITGFMEKEWFSFWETGDRNRLMTSLIINEQNIIEPVIKKRSLVFHSILFFLQDCMHFSTVLFPTCKGELYGASVSHFRNLDERIELGKRLADLLFREELFPHFFEFASKTEPTGARFDYEQYRKRPRLHETPSLRTVYPVVSHRPINPKNWHIKKRVKKKWFLEPQWHEPPLLTDWFDRKQKHLHVAAMLMNSVSKGVSKPKLNN